MSDINNPSASKNKKFDTLSLTDNNGNNYLFVRSGSGRGFFNIARCEVSTNGRFPNMDGVLPDAVLFTNEEVAELVAAAEERKRLLESVESLLPKWIELRRSRSRKAKQKRPRLQPQQQKQGVVQ